MKKFITFTLIVEKQDNVQIDVDPTLIESIVEGRVVNNAAVTQISMASGIRFFVNHSLAEVRLKLNQQATWE